MQKFHDISSYDLKFTPKNQVMSALIWNETMLWIGWENGNQLEEWLAARICLPLKLETRVAEMILINFTRFLLAKGVYTDSPSAFSLISFMHQFRSIPELISE